VTCAAQLANYELILLLTLSNMDSIESKIKACLSGEVIDDPEKEFLNIDYTLQQQHFELSI